MEFTQNSNSNNLGSNNSDLTRLHLTQLNEIESKAQENRSSSQPQIFPQVPKVSVIIPSYNCERYVTIAIDSILNQSYCDVEIVVVDDGSTDNTRQVLEAYGDRIRYIYQEHRGLSDARNRGIAESRGELLAFLDSDNFFKPGKLSAQVACFQARPSLGLVQTGWSWVDSDGRYIKDIKWWEKVPRLDLEGWMMWNCVLPSALMVRREWMERVGGFDTQCSHDRDLALVLRLASMGCEAEWLRQCLVGDRQHENSMTSKGCREQVRDRWAAIDYTFGQPNLPKKVRQLEGEYRYRTLLWMAWSLYDDGWVVPMTEYLELALSYFSGSPVEAIAGWIDDLTRSRTERSGDLETYLDAYTLTQHPEWQELMQRTLEFEPPRVSVIITAYNRARFLPQAIDSVLAQTYTRYEIIVIDDGSTDNTREVLEAYLDRIRYFHQQHQGMSASRNRAVNLARGKSIVFLDAEDLFLPEKLELQVACFDRRPTLGLLNSGWRVLNEAGEVVKDEELWHKAPILDLKAWIECSPVRLSAKMFRKSWFQRVGGFDTTLARSEDVDLILRLAMAGCPCDWLRQVTICYHLDRDNATLTSAEQAEKSLETIECFFSRRQPFNILNPYSH